MCIVAGTLSLTIHSSHAEPYIPSPAGEITIEAEHFDLNVSQGGRDWIADFTPGYVGDSAMLSDPNSWLSVSSNIAASSPRMDYEVEYASPVVLNVWIRGLGPSGSEDSVWVGIDGNDATVLRINPTRGAYGWETSSGQLTVPAGVHTINVWMREDGTIVDRLFLTPLSTVPAGNGPPESNRGGGTPGNNPPVAFDDSFTVSEDSTANALAVLANNGGGGPDSDPDGDPLTVVSVVSPGSAGGTVVVNGPSNGLAYTPSADFFGTETFNYTIGDGLGGFATATVTVTVNNSNNDVPVLDPVGNQSATEDQTLSFSVSASDPDITPAPVMTADLSLLSGMPSYFDNGNGTANFSWTPAPGDAPGPYSVTFTATDALDGTLTSFETISVSVQATGGGGGGSGSGAYQPDGNGQVVMEAENFDLNVSQGGRQWVDHFGPGVGQSMLAWPDSWLSVNTNIATSSPRMDYKVVYASPVALNVWIRGSGASGSADSVWVGVDGDDSTVLRVNPPRGGIGWATSTGQLVVPAGVHTINVWMREDGTSVDRLLLTPFSTVPTGEGPPESSRQGGLPGNNPPVALDDSFIVSEDSSANPLAVLLNNGGGGPDSDPDGDPVTVISVVSPGSAGGTVVVNASSDGLEYTPFANYFGAETFDYTIGDGLGGFSSASVTVTVNNSNNDVPVLDPIGDRSATEDQPLSFTVSASDPDITPAPVMTANLSLLSGTPSFFDNGDGTAEFSWTPAPGDAPGPHSVMFTATDALDGALTSSETVSIYVLAAGGGSGAYQPDGSGQVVMEAEHFDLNVSQGGRNWISDFTPGYVGDSAMLSDPNSWLSVSSNIATSSPRMDYEVEFASPVVLNVWIRGLGPSGSEDSVWVGVDGNDTTVLRINPTRGVYGWETSSGQLTVPAGVHTINVWMREDGTIVDRLLLTPLSTLPTGNGPAESSRGAGGGGDPALPFADNFSDGSADGWVVVDDATKFASNWSVIGGAYLQSEWTNSSGKDVTESYHRGSYAYASSLLSLTDYRFTVDITPQASSADDIGVMFRYTDNNNFYRLSLNNLNGFARLESNINGTYITLASNLRGYVAGQLQNIVVEVEGPLIQVWVNGDPLFSAYDTDHLSGGVALFTRDGSSFDSVSVTVNSPTPEIVIASPVAHTVIPNGPLSIDVTAIARNVPSPNGAVSVQYQNGGGPISCNVSSEGPAGVFTAQCPGVPVGDYTIEGLLLDNGVEIDRDSNQSVAVGSVLSQSHRYDAIGNSITRGVGDNLASDNTNLNDQRTLGVSGWPALLGDFLTTATGVPNLVGNEGIAGDYVSDTRFFRINSIIERNPGSNRALLSLGTNDSNPGVDTTSTAALVNGIQSIVDSLHGGGRDTVFLGLLPPAWGDSLNTTYSDPLDPSATRNQTIISYNTAIQGMLPQSGVVLGPDLFSCFLTPTVNRFSLFDDSLHPNSLGYVFIAALWRDAITGAAVIPPVDPCPSPIYILGSLDPYAHGHKQNLLEVGDEYYTDESFTLTSIPVELDDGIWVMQANADNNNSDLNFLNFDAGESAVTIYIAYDPAGDPPTSSTHLFTPVTLAGDLTVSDPAVATLGLVSATGVTGTVTIGGNKSGPSAAPQQGYLLIVVP